MKRLIPALLILSGFASPAAAQHTSPTADAPQPVDGILVMAHGGSEEWNRAVADAVAPIGTELPTAVAFGMADPRSLSVALDSLRGEGVTRVSVVRMFISGKSFLSQTEYLLGLSPEPPARWILMDHGSGDEGGGDDHGGDASTSLGGHGGHGGSANDTGDADHAGDADQSGDPQAPSPISHGMTVQTHVDGLMDSAEARQIMAARALELSESPERESVLILAHGMGDEAENAHLLEAMQEVAEGVEAMGFHAVQTATLREDWPEERAIAEERIQSFVRSESEAGRRVLVVPFRLWGFGPYAEVLEGLEYTPGQGLLPHAEITTWIRNTASGLMR